MDSMYALEGSRIRICMEPGGMRRSGLRIGNVVPEVVVDNLVARYISDPLYIHMVVC